MFFLGLKGPMDSICGKVNQLDWTSNPINFFCHPLCTSWGNERETERERMCVCEDEWVESYIQQRERYLTIYLGRVWDIVWGWVERERESLSQSLRMKQYVCEWEKEKVVGDNMRKKERESEKVFVGSVRSFVAKARSHLFFPSLHTDISNCIIQL